MTESTAPPICFVDTETTGLHPDRRAWEVAIIRREDGKDRTWLMQVEDVDLSSADPFALQIGGFYERHVSIGHKMPFASAICEPGSGPASAFSNDEAQVARTVEKVTRGAHMVGLNPGFDADVFDKMLRRHNMIPGWNYHLIDVANMALGAIHADADLAPNAQAAARIRRLASLPYKSDVLAGASGVAPAAEDERHTALGDARWAMRWYDKLTGTAA